MADVWLRSFAAALPTMRRAHSDDEVRGWVAGVLALSEGWLDQLYLSPGWRGRGIGDRFVALAKSRQPRGLQVWTFQVNEPARRFYLRHGFAEVERTDGSGNEEREPDVRLAWRPARG